MSFPLLLFMFTVKTGTIINNHTFLSIRSRICWNFELTLCWYNWACSLIKCIWRGSCYVGTPWDFQNIETKILRWGKPHILHFMGTMCVIGKVLDLIEASCAPHDFKNEPCRCIFFVTQNFATILNQIYNLNYGTTKWYRQINMIIISIIMATIKSTLNNVIIGLILHRKRLQAFSLQGD